jgi:hypothetical protein
LAALVLSFLLVVSSPRLFFRHSTITWFLFLASVASLGVFQRYFIYLTFFIILLLTGANVLTWLREEKLTKSCLFNWLLEGKQSLSNPSSQVHEQKLSTELTKAVRYFSYFTLGLLILSAAIPRRRYDQWNYHLSVPKWVMDLGGLPREIFNDHLYFSGSYEYFVGIFRIFSSHDIFIQSATSALTLLLVSGLSSFLLVYFFSSSFKFESLKDKWLLFLGFFLLAAMSPWDRECLYSAKPDYLLIPLTIAVVGLMSSLLKAPPSNLLRSEGESKPSKVDLSDPSFLLGFLLSAGVAIKITWIHFALSCVLGGGISILISSNRSQINWYKFVFGLCIGALIPVSVIAKNYIYFADPLYPAATPGFASGYRLHYVDSYWLQNSSPPRSWTAILDFFIKLPKVLLINYGFLFIAILISVAPSWETLKSAFQLKNIARYFNRPSICLLISYILLWPLLHRVDIFPRFIIPIAAVLVWEIAFHAKSLKNIYFAAFFLFIAQANPNILVRDVFRSVAGEQKFYANTSEGEAIFIARELSKYLNAVPLASESEGNQAIGVSEVRILTNSTVSYFFDSESWSLCTYPLRVELEKRGLHFTDEEWKGPFSESVISQIIKVSGIKYYVHLNNDYCIHQEMIDYMKKYGLKISGDFPVYKIEN